MDDRDRGGVSGGDGGGDRSAKGRKPANVGVRSGAKGRSRAELGATSLEVTRTGTVEKRAESSLVLFDKEGKVLWEAP